VKNMSDSQSSGGPTVLRGWGGEAPRKKENRSVTSIRESKLPEVYGADKGNNHENARQFSGELSEKREVSRGEQNSRET